MVLATPMTVNLMTCTAAAGKRAGSEPGTETSWPAQLGDLQGADGETGAEPRHARRSARAVATMSTRESGSSTQSTGISWMRNPARSARTSSSVSKNQPVS